MADIKKEEYKQCPWCGKLFIAKYKNKVYCSQKCRQKWRKKENELRAWEELQALRESVGLKRQEK